MSEFTQFPGYPVTKRHAVRVLQAFSDAAEVSFDQILAIRVLGEVERAIEGDDASAWTQRLVEVGESLGLRIRSIECNFADVITFVQQSMPVAFYQSVGQGEPRWYVMQEMKGNKIRVVELGEQEKESWISLRKLRKMRDERSDSGNSRWILGQAALSCQAPTHSAHEPGPHQHLSPLKRLIVFMRPEKKDLWMILIFSFVVGVLALAPPIAVEALVNSVAFGRYLQPVIVLSMLLFTFLAFAASMRALTAFIVEVLQRRLFLRVVEDLAYRLPRTQQAELDNAHGPELVNRFFDIVTVQKSVASLLLGGIAIVLQAVVGMVVLAFYHPFLLGFDVVLLLLMLFAVVGLGQGAVKTAVKESKTKFAIAAWLEELVRHPTAFKLNAGSQFAIDRADRLAVDWLNARQSHFRVVLRQILFTLGLQAVAATTLLGLGGWLVIVGELTLGQLVAAELIVMVIVGSFAKFGKHLESLYDLLAAVDKLGHLFDLSTESNTKLFHLRGGEPASLRLHDVSFAFAGHKVLKNISESIASGEKVALVGDAGSGKTTLMEMISSLRTPTTGHIELDSIDIRELRPDSQREHVAHTGAIEIFKGTIDENIHLNRPQIQALDVREAIASVGLLDELLRLPDGLNTQLQTNGAPLSSSQAVRLMLARAVVARPRLLLIDGTLDSLSGPLLEEVLAHLCTPKAPWTMLIATGRQEVIAASDRVISLNSSHHREIATAE